MTKVIACAAIVFASILVSGCSSHKDSSRDSSGRQGGSPSFAYITNGVTGFWEIAQAGAEAAGKDLDVDVTVIMPSSMADQTRKIEDLLVRGTNGIAISPIDSANQGEIINEAAAQTKLITQDSDAPETNRLAYIGMDNYVAGMMCGRTLLEALPQGGRVLILIGRLDQDNAKRRRQGCIDGFLAREADPTRNDPPGGVISSEDGKYTVLGTMTDQFDRAKAKANAEDALTRHPDISAMVGLFDYNPQMIIEALERAGKLGQVKVMAFDENSVMLQGIKEGTVIGTVVQNPYQYGYQSIQMLNELHKGNSAVIPASRFIDIPARVINAANVDAFQQEIKDRLAEK